MRTPHAAKRLRAPETLAAVFALLGLLAAAEARPGEVVLLAPAAASFDQYDDFEARGADFMAQVARVLG